MRKTTRNYLIVMAQALATVLLAVSAVLLWLVFPRGFFAARALWIDIHKWVGLALGGLVFLHVALHWSWLVQMTRRHLVSLCNAGRRTWGLLSHPVQGRKVEPAGGKDEQEL